MRSTPSIREYCEHLDPIEFYKLKLVHYRAITHGMSHLIGQVAPGQFADLVLWKPENFGTKPEVVIKGGFIAWAQVRITFALIL